MERWDYYQDLSSQSIVPALNIQDKRQSKYRFNTEDIWKRTYVHYQTDYTDLTGIDYFDPTDAEYSTEAVNVNNADLLTIKGYNDVSIPFALAYRKQRLTLIEKVFKAFCDTADFVVNVFGGNSTLSAQINNRVGIMTLSQQYYSTSKIMWVKLSDGKQPYNYLSRMAAKEVYERYHSINQIAKNDWKIYEDVPVRMTSQEFVSLLDNNYAEIDGVICEVLVVQFKDEQSLATITYREPFNWADGKVTTLTINE
jgi:hypothetical protein